TKAFAGSDRFKASDMPHIDVLVITHDHWDHLDRETVTLLREKVDTVVCGLGVGAHLEWWGYPSSKIVELDWNDSLSVSASVVLRALPARHFSGRGLSRSRSLWCSFAVKSPQRSVYLGGDGGAGAHFVSIGKEHGPFDLAILEQGQYDSAWRNIHLLPQLLPRTMRELRASRLLPVHNSKFCISRHPWTEPLRLLQAGADSGGYGLLTPRIGEVASLSDTTRRENWWLDLK
ncbi:MAG TPA: MBL fold metallo-hydrolase, partial [Fibrobacteria bacterium]|nr:MBL fold metallo-hydrolase [Fibrobacteria bacterium]